MDPHKGLFLPFGSGALLVRDETQLAEAHRYSAAYLRDSREAGVFSPSDLSVELSRPFRGPRLWLPLKLFGLAPPRRAEEKPARPVAHSRLAEMPGWVVGPEPDLSIFTYRYVPRRGDANELNRRLVKAVGADGASVISATEIDGSYTLRLAILHYRSHLDEVDRLLETLAREAVRLEVRVVTATTIAWCPPWKPTTVLTRAAGARRARDSRRGRGRGDRGRRRQRRPARPAILDLFSEPTALSEALERLGPRAGGAQDWIDLTAAVARLHEAGVLRAEGEPERAETASSSRRSTRLARTWRCWKTAFGRPRSSPPSTRSSVPRTWSSTSGRGRACSRSAPRAGARHVYAIEATPLADEAQEVVRGNGLEDRVTVVPGWSTRVSLPERATVAVSEILGSDALEERVLPVLLDARRRLLVPTRLIPSVVRIYGQPVFRPGRLPGRPHVHPLEHGPLEVVVRARARPLRAYAAASTTASPP